MLWSEARIEQQMLSKEIRQSRALGHARALRSCLRTCRNRLSLVASFMVVKSRNLSKDVEDTIMHERRLDTFRAINSRTYQRLSIIAKNRRR